MKTTDDALEELAKKHIDGRLAMKALQYTQLNPEQKLACVLEMVLQAGKTKLLMMEVCKHLAEETIAWKKTPEGMAWQQKKDDERMKRALDAAEKV